MFVLIVSIKFVVNQNPNVHKHESGETCGLVSTICVENGVIGKGW